MFIPSKLTSEFSEHNAHRMSRYGPVNSPVYTSALVLQAIDVC